MGVGKPQWPELKMEVNNMMMLVVITLAVIPLVVGEQHNDGGRHGGVFVGLCRSFISVLRQLCCW